jgi:putative ABC transport system permease protein
MLAFFNSLPGAVCQGIIWGIMAIGVYVTFKILDMADLSVDGSFGTGGAVLVACVTGGMNIWLALLISTIAGCVAGLVTGILHTKFGIPAILAGILTQLGLYSINLRILGGQANKTVSANNYHLLLTLREIPKSIIVAALIMGALIMVSYFFFGTEIGESLRATGANQNMARANGINTDFTKVLGLIISNGIVAFSGALLAQYQGFADVNMGRGAIVIGLAAVIIGEVIFHKIFKNFALRLLAAVFGGIIYYVVLTLVLRMGLNANDLKLFSAIVVAVFLGVPYWKNKVSQKVKKN